MADEKIEMKCLYGQGICIREKCYAFYYELAETNPHCRFVDQCIRPMRD